MKERQGGYVQAMERAFVCLFSYASVCCRYLRKILGSFGDLAAG